MEKLKNNTKLKSEDLTLEEKVGQLLMFAFHGTEFNDQLLTQIEKLKVGGVIFFGRNIVTPAQVTKLTNEIQAHATIPLYIGVDQEGGTVQRIINGVTPFPGAMAISATQNSNYEVSRAVGDDLRKMGFNMNFAPVGDVNNNPNNPVINSRSYSDDPEVCAKYVIDGAKGFLDSGVIPTCKHFPGHGDTAVDSHIGLPVVDFDEERLNNVGKLEKNRNSKATAFGLGVGVFGLFLLIFGLMCCFQCFLLLNLTMSIICSCAGLILVIIFAIFLPKISKKEKSDFITNKQKIETEINEICKKALSLIGGDKNENA